MVYVALQVGVPLSLVNVMSGGVAACENVSWTQSSFRLFSLEAGDVIVMVVVSSSSDLMASSKLIFSWLVSCAGSAALVACRHRQEERGGQTEHPDETRRGVVSQGEITHVQPSNGAGRVTARRCRGRRHSVRRAPHRRRSSAPAGGRGC